MKIHKYEAINALYEGNVTQLSDGTFEYHSGGSIPTEEAIQAKLVELQADYDSKNTNVIANVNTQNYLNN